VVLGAIDASTWAQIGLEPRVVAPSDPAMGHRLIEAAILNGALVSAAVAGTRVVGLAVAGPRDDRAERELLAIGVAPAFRRHGLATRLLEACVAADDVDVIAEVTVAERDPIEPLDRALRARIARQLLERAGFEIAAAAEDVRLADPSALRAVRRMPRP
jgi:ribosomal protein S18 acetylase RimI-like enzyme